MQRRMAGLLLAFLAGWSALFAAHGSTLGLTITSTVQNSVRQVSIRRGDRGLSMTSDQGVLRFGPEQTTPPTFAYLPVILRGAASASATPTSTASPTRTPAAPVTATATPTFTSTATPTATPATAITPPAAQGHITYSLPDGAVYRLAAAPGATPENITTALNGLAPGGGDDQLNLSRNGAWLVLDTERFHPDCNGWSCLVLVKGDLSAGEAVQTGGGVIHPEGLAAVSNDGNLIVYPATEGPHTRDLWAVRRTGGVWTTPVLLTGASPYAYQDFPVLSADGSQVLMDCSPDSFPSRAICTVGTDGSDFRTVLDQTGSPPGLPDVGALHHPAYAGDGSIVFEGDWGGELIWRLPVGESVPVRVNARYDNDNSPCVLPDGRIVSLWLNRPGGQGFHELKVMAADGSGGVVLLPDVDVFDVGLGCGE